MTVRYTVRARRDLEKILDYLGQRSPTGAMNVSASIERSVAQLDEFPKSGTATNFPGLRVKIVPLYGYKLFYRQRGPAIEIVHVRHAARRPLRGV